eukprot:579498-Rhodomonas_salina.1
MDVDGLACFKAARQICAGIAMFLPRTSNIAQRRSPLHLISRLRGPYARPTQSPVLAYAKPGTGLRGPYAEPAEEAQEDGEERGERGREGGRLEVEKNLVNGRLKALTAYFGPLAPRAWKEKLGSGTRASRVLARVWEQQHVSSRSTCVPNTRTHAHARVGPWEGTRASDGSEGGEEGGRKGGREDYGARALAGDLTRPCRGPNWAKCGT